MLLVTGGHCCAVKCSLPTDGRRIKISYFQNPKGSAIDPLVPGKQESCVTQLELLSGLPLWGCLGRVALFIIADNGIRIIIRDLNLSGGAVTGSGGFSAAGNCHCGSEGQPLVWAHGEVCVCTFLQGDIRRDSGFGVFILYFLRQTPRICPQCTDSRGSSVRIYLK